MPVVGSLRLYLVVLKLSGMFGATEIGSPMRQILVDGPQQRQTAGHGHRAS